MTYRPISQQEVPFQFRPGVGGFPGWGGMHQDGDPGTVPANGFRLAENVRFDANIVRGRYGLGALGVNLGGVPFYMGSFQCQAPHKRMWIRIRGCPGVGAGTGCSLAFFDPEGSPVFQTHSLYFGPVDTTEVMGDFGDDLFVGHNDVLRIVSLIQPKLGQSAGALNSSLAHNPLRTFPGERIVCMQNFPEINRFFIGLQNVAAPTTGRIVSYNGLSFVQEFSGANPIQFGRWRNQIVASFDGNIRWRDNTGSTWTSIAFGGFTTSTSQNAIVEYEDRTYFASGSDEIYAYDGVAVSLDRTIATCATSANTGVMSLANHRGHLYYLWNTTDPAFNMKLGKFDNDNAGSGLDWRDTYVDLFAQNANNKTGRALASFRSTLFAGRGQQTLLGSPMNDVQGTWITINGGSLGTNFPLDSFLVF